MNNIYVGNLPYQMTEEELNKLFAQYGEVSKLKLINDQFTGQSKGFAFVEMARQMDAEEAIKGLNNYLIKGRNLRVNQARPQNDRNNKRKRRY
jgi:RNA recognition motif-containing protein